MEFAVRNCPRLLIFDTLSQYQPGSYTVFEQPGSLRSYLRDRISGGRFRILYQPKQGEIAEHFEAVNCCAAACGNLVYCVDEMDKFTQPNWLPFHLKQIANYSRHFRMALLFTSRRPTQIARELTSQCSEFWLFRNTEPRDLRYFREYIGEQALTELPKLRDWEYVSWCEDGSILKAGGRIVS